MLGRDIETGVEVAVKIMKEAEAVWQSTAAAEVEALEALRIHRNVIGLIDHGRAIYHETCSESRVVDFIVLELATGGVLSDVIVKSGCFDETMARHYFKQLIAGLDHCHRRGFAHRDLKP